MPHNFWRRQRSNMGENLEEEEEEQQVMRNEYK
jgi:hypothetical protein